MAKFTKTSSAVPTPGATFFGTQLADTINVVANPRSGFKFTDGLGGNDTMYGSIYGDGLIGNLGDDKLFGNAGNDMLSGGAGNDLLDGGVGIDYATYRWDSAAVSVDLSITTAQNTGGSGFDTLVNIENLEGSAYNDTLRGDANANIIYTGAGNNLVESRGGNDTIYTGGGNDRIVAGDGNDLIYSFGGSSNFDGGLGIDTLDFSNWSQGVSIDLALTGAQTVVAVAGLSPSVETIRNIENLVGGSGDNTLSGDDNANVLVCSNAGTVYNPFGANTGSNDVLNGRGGNDTLVGGDGNDLLTGGSGADTFVFNAPPTNVQAVDTITDFNATEGDKIDLHYSIWGAAITATFIGEAAFTGVMGQVRVTGVVGNQTIEVDQLGNGTALEVIHVVSALALTADDFLF